MDKPQLFAPDRLWVPEFIADPYPTYHRLREQTPLNVVSLPVGSVAGIDEPVLSWALMKHDDVYRALRDHDTFSSAFPNPDEFRLDRDLRDHVAFGSGIHYCLGAPLARAEAGVTLNTLLDRCAVLKRGAAPALRQTMSVSFFGFQQLPLALGA